MICLIIFPPHGSEGGSSENDYYGCLVYFGIAAVMMLAGLISVFFFFKLPYVMYYMNKAKTQMTTDSSQLDISGSPFNQRLEVQSSAPSQMEDGYGHEMGLTEVLKKIYPRAIAVFLCFFCTFLIFPSVFFRGAGLKSITGDAAWFIILMIFTFNVFDTIGRTLGGKFFIFTPKNLIIPIICR